MRRIRQETLTEKIYRFRGVALVVSVPLVLIAIVVTMMPRSSPLESGRMTDDPLDRLSVDASAMQSKETETTTDASDKYAVIIDAGSTGSRIHVYKFNGALELQEVGNDLELFIKIKPGLSSYKDEPTKGGESFKSLLDKALEVVPESLRRETPVRVGATAGLRLLQGDLADQLLGEVRKVLADYPFQFTDEDVKILDGADEGSFAWMTVNYLLGKLGQEIVDTVGVIDLGGGSVQLTYAVSDDVAEKAPSDYVRKVKGMGKAYNLYVHSYLGYGLMAARAEMLKRWEHNDGHPCIVRGFSDEYHYGQKSYPAVASTDGASHEQCVAVAKAALNLDTSCTFEKCSFNGIWSGGGGAGVQNVYVASYFFDRAGELGVIPDAKVPSVEVTPKQFKEAAEKVCPTPLEDIEKSFPDVEKKDAGYVCLDITYQYTLLTAGFGIGDDSKVTLVKQVIYKEKEVEAAWPLGAAIAALS